MPDQDGQRLGSCHCFCQLPETMNCQDSCSKSDILASHIFFALFEFAIGGGLVKKKSCLGNMVLHWRGQGVRLNKPQ